MSLQPRLVSQQGDHVRSLSASADEQLAAAAEDAQTRRARPERVDERITQLVATQP